MESTGPIPALKNDKVFLAIISSVNYDSLRTPWRTIAYDYSFSTMIEENGKLRALRRSIAREKMFIKSYFQTRTFHVDPVARSPVFAYDRFLYPKYDEEFIKDIPVEQMGTVTTVKIFLEAFGTNFLDNLILAILSKSDNPEVIEALGHNQLLFLADKAVKAEIKTMKGLLRGVADLELGTLARKERFFTITRRYRDQRQEMEFARQRAARGEAVSHDYGA
jgi:hypothetical protein